MNHVILLGDSVFDNGVYVADGDPDVERQLKLILPRGCKATRLAVDGAVIGQIGVQLRRLPGDATHLVISAGGNDALREYDVLSSSASSVEDALTQLADIGDRFDSEYSSMLSEVSRVGLLTAVCTIYEPPEVPQRIAAATALTLLNDKITKQTFARGMTLIDLRLICVDNADFSHVSPIEPSAQGGAKIARAISRFARGETPRSSVFSDR
jgi:hypothetical protein